MDHVRDPPCEVAEQFSLHIIFILMARQKCVYFFLFWTINLMAQCDISWGSIGIKWNKKIHMFYSYIKSLKIIDCCDSLLTICIYIYTKSRLACKEEAKYASA